MSASFIHLHVHSAYSLAEGAIQVKDLTRLCREMGMPAVAVTDTNNMFGALEFAMAAAKAGVQPIIGCQFRLGLEGHQLVFLVQSEAGYRSLCKLVSDAYLGGDPAQDVHATWEQLAQNAEGLICLTGGIKGPVAQYLLHNQPKEAEAALKKLAKIYPGRLYIELQRHGLDEETRCEEALIGLAYKHDVPLVATNDCYFPTRDMHEAHDALLCIAAGRYVTETGRRTETPEHYFKSAEDMRHLFADLPEACDNTLVIARRCHFLLKPIEPQLPAFKTESGRTEIEELTAQSEDGLEWRLKNFVYPELSSRRKPGSSTEQPEPDPGLRRDDKKEEDDREEKERIAKIYRDRMKYELGVITQMGFSGYFLIVSDFIKWAKEHNIPVGPGRGSGAGSVVSWAMKITDIDPLPFNLLFERMLNPERVSMPDFDIDFCQERRDEVIKYVQQRYGYDHVAQIITFGKLQARAVVRDVGRVLQMPYGQVDRIAKMIPANPANPISLEDALLQDEELRNERKKDETTDKLIAIALQLEGLYRHASTHAAGVVIGRRPLYEMLPMYRDPRSTMPVTQFNMKYVEPAGLVKFDFLGLKTMTVIQKTVNFIKESCGEDVDILKVPLDDPKTYEMLARGENVGVFQLESAGMRDLGRQMRISNFEQIIALVALYRPGPMENIPKYLASLHGQEERDYMHEKLKPFLEDTYGVMIYQEQVMQAAQALSGYTLGGADLLRRAMGKKIKEEMDAQRDLFVRGALEHSNVPPQQANHIFDQIAKFAGYGFNKAHSAGYALISYWTAWLKANYPVQFMAASMTLDMGNTDKLAVFKQELSRMGIGLLPPDINKSMPEFKVELIDVMPAQAGIQSQGHWTPASAGVTIEGTEKFLVVRYALAALKGVGAAAMQKLVAERDANGPFRDLNDFAMRLDSGTMNKRGFEQLACAGAFDTLNPNRAQLYEGAERVLRFAQAQAQEREAGQTSLFGGNAGGLAAAGLDLDPVPPWDALEKLRFEFEAVGFYLSAHPLDTKIAQLDKLGVVSSARVLEKLAHRPAAAIDMAGVVIKKQVKVSPKSGNKYAFVQLSDSAGVFEALMFSETLAKSKDMLEPGETVLLKVLAEEKDEQIRYTIQDVRKLEDVLNAKLQGVQIHLTGPKPVTRLKELLDVEGKGRAQISVIVDIEDGRQAELSIPGRWNFSYQARSALQKLEGVREVREF